MNERNQFTANALDVLKHARRMAKELRQDYIGTEHLLLGLVYVTDSLASSIMQMCGVEYGRVLRIVENMVASAPSAPSDDPRYTPRVRRILSNAMEAAEEMNAQCVRTEHILLALLEENGGAAAEILEHIGVDPSSLQGEVLDYIEGQPAGHITVERVQETGKEESARKKGSILAQFGRDLTEMAKEGKLDPVIGRETEIERVIQILARRTKNNPILLGEPGVGKTAIAEGLAQRIAEASVPHILQRKRIVSVSMASLVAGTKYRGEFEERMKWLVEELVEAKDVVLFMDEMHTLIGAGSGEGSLDAANILKPALSRGEIRVIGATTLDEYKKRFERDAALARRFQTVLIEEPTQEAARAILLGLRDRYESFHHASISDEAIEAAVKLSARYISDRFLPDKAIDLMDEAAAKARVRESAPQDAERERRARLDAIAKEKEAAIEAQDYEQAARLRDQEQALKEELEKARAEDEARGGSPVSVTQEDIAGVVSLWTGIPVRQIAAKESERLLRMERILAHRVVGQDVAIRAVAKAVRRARAGLKDPKRPIGSFLFLGPTGVGKTELAKALAESLFGTEEAMIRFDMSEYMEKHTVSRLIGAPPGYVGYEEGGQLTDAVRRKPYSIILLDEVEKAHPDVFNMLLQVLDDGRLTDGKGRTVDFCNTVIIMTSNAGASRLGESAGTMGFAARRDEAAEQKAEEARVMEEVRRIFRPEFLNRVDEMVVFRPLRRETLSAIVDILLRDVKARLMEKGIALEVSPAAKARLIEQGTDAKYGARPLKRAIQKHIEDALAERLLAREFKAGDTVQVRRTGGELVFLKKADSLRKETVGAAQ